MDRSKLIEKEFVRIKQEKHPKKVKKIKELLASGAYSVKSNELAKAILGLH